jgi:hypothetical protein
MLPRNGETSGRSMTHHSGTAPKENFESLAESIR